MSQVDAVLTLVTVVALAVGLLATAYAAHAGRSQDLTERRAERYRLDRDEARRAAAVAQTHNWAWQEALSAGRLVRVEPDEPSDSAGDVTAVTLPANSTWIYSAHTEVDQ